MEDFEKRLNMEGYFIEGKGYRKDYVYVKGPYGLHHVRICSLYKGGIPGIQTAVDKDTYFLQKAREIHGDKFEYLKTNYKNKRTIIEYNCSEHGIVKQSVMSHLKGSGCPMCGHKKISNSRKLNSGWSLSNWKELASKSTRFDSFKFYIIEIHDNNEHFIKIGRTYLTLKNRYRGKLALPYSYNVIRNIIDTPENIFNLENMLKNKFKKFNYIPKKKFNGMYECFNLEVLKLILEELDNSKMKK